MPYFNRYDIVSAYYLFGRDYHGGQFSKEYKYLGRAVKCGFNPGPLFSEESLTDNGKEIYQNLVSGYFDFYNPDRNPVLWDKGF